MKRLLKTIVIIGAMGAGATMLARLLLSRRAQPEAEIPVWNPPPRTEPDAHVDVPAKLPEAPPEARHNPPVEVEAGAEPEGAATAQRVPSDEPTEFAAEAAELEVPELADEPELQGEPAEAADLFPDEDPLDFAAEVASVETADAFDAPVDATPEITAAAEAERDDFLSRAFDQLAASETATRVEPQFLEQPVDPALAAPPEEPGLPAPEAAAQHEAASIAEPEALPDSLEEALSGLDYVPIQPPPARNAESYLDEGNVYFNVGQYALAIERYSRAAELDPNLIAAYYNRANARTRAGEFELALEDYDRALTLQPHDADALNNRGMLHLYRTNYAAALQDFNAALAADPSDTTVMVNRGLANLHGDNPQAALDDFRQATAADEHDAAAHYGTAQAAAALGDRDGALQSVERALRIDPAYAREAAGDPRLTILQGDETFLRLLRESGTRSS